MSHATVVRQPEALAGSSLSETVGAFCKDVARMRSEIHAANKEIARLRKKLAVRDTKIQKPNFRALRRQISFYCHPDRGGDDNLMRRVNLLFYYLECSAEGVLYYPYLQESRTHS